MLGNPEPRLCTPALRPLTRETSDGFEVIDFARDVLGRPLLPWQENVVVRAMELREDGSLRFRIVLLLVARQNGKTELLAVMPAYWMAVEESPMVLGISTKLDYSKETWEKSRKLIQKSEQLDALRPKDWYMRGAGFQELKFVHDAGERHERESRYKIAASTNEGGRSLTVRNLMIDEFRHTNHATWDAAEPTTSAVDDAQIWLTSNAGDDTSDLLNEMRDAAVRFIETGEGDDSTLLIEWSAPEDADPADPEALLQANPSCGYTGMKLSTLVNKAQAAVKAGGQTLTVFKTNYLCQRVKVMNPAIDPGAWRRCSEPGTLDAHKARAAWCVDVAPDGRHVTLAAAAVLPDARVRVEVIKAWDSTAAARRELPRLVAANRPPAFGWFPSGPAAALATDLATPPPNTPRPAASWPPPGVVVAPLVGEMAAVCMGLEAAVRERLVVHSDDPLLNHQVAGAERMKRGDRWVFVRHGADEDLGHVDAVYAVAGAAHLARTLPAPVGKPRLVFAREDG